MGKLFYKETLDIVGKYQELQVMRNLCKVKSNKEKKMRNELTVTVNM